MLRARGGPGSGELAFIGATAHRAVFIVAQRPLVSVIARCGFRNSLLYGQNRVTQRSADTDTVICTDCRNQGIVNSESIITIRGNICFLTSCTRNLVILVGLTCEDIGTSHTGIVC